MPQERDKKEARHLRSTGEEEVRAAEEDKEDREECHSHQGEQVTMRISPKLPTQKTAAGTGFLASLAVVCLCSFLAPPVLAAPGEGCANEAVRAESHIDPTTGQPYSQGLPEC